MMAPLASVLRLPLRLPPTRSVAAAMAAATTRRAASKTSAQSSTTDGGAPGGGVSSSSATQAASTAGDAAGPRVLLFDGSYLIYRAAFAAPPLRAADGTPTGAAFLLVRTLQNLMRILQPQYVAFCLDGGSAARKALYPAYKATRVKREDLLPASAYAVLDEAVAAVGIKSIRMDGEEADDIIASYTADAMRQGWTVGIVSRDKDMMQLLDEARRVQLYDAVSGEPQGWDEAQAKWQVKPTQLCDLFALAGDSSDNIPGVAGIGPVTAAKLVQQYGSVEELLRQLDSVTPAGRRDKLIAGQANLPLWKQLVTLNSQLVLAKPWDELQWQFDTHHFLRFIGKYQFHSLIPKSKKR